MAPAPDSYTFQAVEKDMVPYAKPRFQRVEQDAQVSDGNLFQRLTGGIKGFVNGFWTPGTPLPTVPPPNTPPRQYDYPITTNIDIEPRAGVPIKFGELIALANQWDILRTIIERRKDQLAKMPWSIQAKDPDKDLEGDEEAAAIQLQLQRPDNEHDMATFQRAMMEEVYVKDALSLEPVYYPPDYAIEELRGKVYGIYGIAGETIQIKIDERGRTPEPPNTAYQQVIKGVVWCDFTKDDLIYKPRNLSFSRMFGFSPVEQIYVITNIALRRQAMQLDAFTSGTLPAALMAMPDGWTPQQIAEYQDRFDSRYTNNLKKRSKLTMVPHGSSPLEFKSDPLKNEFDEWMVRVACGAFGESPEPWIKMMNRATAQTAAAKAAQQGLEPDMSFIEATWNLILEKCFRRPDLCFKFNVDSEIDPKIENDIAMDQIEHGALSIDDFLKAKGRDPIGVGNVFMTPQGPISVEAWLANGGMTPAMTQALGQGAPEPGAGPKATVVDDPKLLGPASKSLLPKGHLARLPMPKGSTQKKKFRL